MFNETALIVDDDVLIGPGLRRSLRMHRIEAQIVGSIAAARAFVLENPAPTFVFLELELPDGEGLSLLPALNAISDCTYVAAVTGHLDARRALALQAMSILAVPKPLSDAALKELIQLLRRKSHPLVAAVEAFARKHKLSPKETRLLRLAVDGVNNDEAGAVLNCARATVATFWNRIFIKTGLRSQRDVLAGMLRERGQAASRTVLQPSAE